MMMQTTMVVALMLRRGVFVVSLSSSLRLFPCCGPSQQHKSVRILQKQLHHSTLATKTFQGRYNTKLSSTVMRTSTTTLLLTASTVSGFAVLPQQSQSSTTALNGLFDGVKEAFSAPALERSQIDSERETPIDRWMGWSVVSEQEGAVEAGSKVAADFIDSMDETNYLAVELEKPMGIIFEENDSEFGGIFVQSLKEDGIAEKNGLLKPGDQLIVVGTSNVSGLDFDEALGAIIDSPDAKTKLTIFRGTAKQFYGPTGPSKEWLSSFCEKAGVEVAAS